MPEQATELGLLPAVALAARWHVTKPTIYSMMREGMPSLLIGRCRRFNPQVCEAWLAERTERAS